MRKTMLAVVALAAVTILAVGLAAGCGGGTTTYTNDEYGFSFDYDSGTFTESDDVSAEKAGADSAFRVAFADPDGTEVGDQKRDGFIVNVYELNANLDEFPAEQVEPELKKEIEGLLPELAAGLGSSATFGSLESISQDEGFGYKVDATFDVEDTPFKSRMFFLFYGDTEYQLTFQAAEDRWSDLEPKFKEVIDSFSVTSADSAE